MGKIIDIPGFGMVTDKDVGETKLFKSSREDYEAEVARVGCSQYAPCPVCYKCMHKAAHLYDQCNGCQVPLCHHNESSRKKLIRPNNFTLEAKGKLAESLQKDIDEYQQSKVTPCKCGGSCGCKSDTKKCSKETTKQCGCKTNIKEEESNAN